MRVQRMLPVRSSRVRLVSVGRTADLEPLDLGASLELDRS